MVKKNEGVSSKSSFERDFVFVCRRN